MHKITAASLLIAYGGIHLMRGHKPSLLHCFKDLIQVEWWWWCYASSLSPVSAYESWLSLCCIHAASALCISPPLPPPLRLDVTNSWICTFLYQNQHAPHHRLVQIWSEHTQNPPAAWWWIGILGTMLMHQSSTRRQMTVNCFSDKSVVWDSTDWGWIEALPRWSRRGLEGGGSRKPCQGNQMMTPPYSAGICRLPLGCISHFQLVWQMQRWNRAKCCLTKGESVGLKYDRNFSNNTSICGPTLGQISTFVRNFNSFYCTITLNTTVKCNVPLTEWAGGFQGSRSSVHKAPVWISVTVRRPS